MFFYWLNFIVFLCFRLTMLNEMPNAQIVLQSLCIIPDSRRSYTVFYSRKCILQVLVPFGNRFMWVVVCFISL
ncbi:hypothetical protein PRUPE_5G039200 [Prunus persica]|uniref:Secreted protein n=1 Tax=Prunus persica TaxID=3760 RepID=A0A251P3G8_PRUPE|nr:hypothetical protein PRUPE_5G039200 [Prunus persica]